MDGPPTDLPPVAALPAPRLPVEPSGADVLRSLGLDALVELVEGASAPVAVLDTERRWLYANPAACRRLGRSFEQLRGAPAGPEAEHAGPGRPLLVGGAPLTVVRLDGPSGPAGDDDGRREAARAAAAGERLRLGRELHDSITPALFALHARAQVVERALAAGDLSLLAEAAEDVQALSGQAVAELRAVVSAVREPPPPAAHDLPAALEQLAAETRSRHGLEVRLRIDRPLPGVAAETAGHLARVAAEAVHNCVKHARVDEVRVELGVRGSELVLAVADDGCGFDTSTGRWRGHGQQTMRERAVLCGGWLHVDAAPGRGTRVVARVPLPG